MGKIILPGIDKGDRLPRVHNYEKDKQLELEKFRSGADYEALVLDVMKFLHQSGRATTADLAILAGVLDKLVMREWRGNMYLDEQVKQVLKETQLRSEYVYRRIRAKALEMVRKDPRQYREPGRKD